MLHLDIGNALAHVLKEKLLHIGDTPVRALGVQTDIDYLSVRNTNVAGN